MTTAPQSAPSKAPARTAVLSFTLDAALVLLFAGIGRGSHARSATFLGLLETAWPFLAGLAIMWLVTLAHRRPTALVRTAIPVWIGTVAIGMGFRAVTGHSTALPFVIVATLTLLLFLVGWRLIALIVRKARAKR